MTITSFRFILFALLTVLVWNIAPKQQRWIVLLASSLVFYASLNVVGLPILCLTSILVWGAALRVQHIQDEFAEWLQENKRNADRQTKRERKAVVVRRQNAVVTVALVACMGNLVLCKYYGPFAMRLNRLFDWRIWTAESVIVPLGISYYTLQLVGYLLDVQRSMVRAERNPLKVILFGCFFLSIMQGPFNRYGDIMPQIVCGEKLEQGPSPIRSATRILGGYVKKMCIADQLAVITGEVFGNIGSYTGLAIAFGIACFAIQLYADFSGYMDIVLGIGQLLGVRLPENFKEPFFSRSISEFWRKWHITLGLWLKDYLFYPILKSHAFKKLGAWLKQHFGKEASRTIPTYLGMLILWSMIGLWHGASFNFIFGTGLLQFFYIFTGEVLEPVFVRMRKVLSINVESLGWHVFQSVRTTLLMMVAWTFFDAPGFINALRMLRRLLVVPATGQLAELFVSDALSATVPSIMIAYVLASALLLLVIDLLRENGYAIFDLTCAKSAASGIITIGLMLIALIVFGAYGAAYDSSNFIYFEF